MHIELEIVNDRKIDQNLALEASSCEKHLDCSKVFEIQIITLSPGQNFSCLPKFWCQIENSECDQFCWHET